MQDLLLSIVFVVCQLLLLVFLFGLIFLPKSDAARPAIRPNTAKAIMMGTAAVVITTAVIEISSFQFRGSDENGAADATSPDADARGRPRVNPPGVRIRSEAWNGRPMIIRFDEDACLKFEFGAIACDADYLAVYDARGNRWTVTGYSIADKRVITMTRPNSGTRPGSLAIWGTLGEFDDAGIVRRFQLVVGTMRVQSEMERSAAKSHEPPASSASNNVKLTALAMQGKPLIIHLNEDACTRFDLGGMACAKDYRAQYEGGSNRWTVTGHIHGETKEITNTADNADPKPGALSIWGAIFRFDDAGAVFRLEERVGNARLETEDDVRRTKSDNVAKGNEPPSSASNNVKLTALAMQGKPLIIRLDEDACTRFDLGGTECATDYRARYEVVSNRWTVTGQIRGETKVVTNTADNADPTPGSLSIWGAIFRFDDAGAVFRLGERVGNARLETEDDVRRAKSDSVAKVNEPPSLPSNNVKLTALAMQGKPLIIRLDEDACTRFDLGGIACATDHRARYEARSNRWTVTGQIRGETKVVTNTADNADPTPGSLSIWGAIFRFDDAGAVFRLDERVGNARLETEDDVRRTRSDSVAKGNEDLPFAASMGTKLTALAMQGRPLIIRLDEDACTRFELGGIACATDYRARYEARSNRWTVAGQIHGQTKVVTNTADNADPKPGALSIWGAIFRFDDAGAVFRLDERVGNARLETEDDVRRAKSDDALQPKNH